MSIHCIDSGIDTGDILCQKEVFFETCETLKTSYHTLHDQMFELFQSNWCLIQQGLVTARSQKSGGTLHYKKDLEYWLAFLNERNWEISVQTFKKLYYEQKSKVSKNFRLSGS